MAPAISQKWLGRTILQLSRRALLAYCPTYVRTYLQAEVKPLTGNAAIPLRPPYLHCSEPEKLLFPLLRPFYVTYASIFLEHFSGIFRKMYYHFFFRENENENF